MQAAYQTEQLERVITGGQALKVQIQCWSENMDFINANQHKSGDGDGSRAMYTVRLFYFLTFEGTPRANWRESGKT